MAKGGVIEAPNAGVDEAASRLDVEIRREWKNSESSLVKVAGMLATMKNDKLWTRLTNPETKEPFRRFEEYVCDVTGNKIARTKVYDMLNIFGLTQGKNALDQKEVDEMGPKHAAELARLEAEDRTPDVVQTAKEKGAESTRKLKKMVQAKLNEKLKPEERKDPTFMFARSLDEPTIQLIEQIEKVGIHMEAVRNGDNSVSALVKLWHYVWACFALDRGEELLEGEKFMDALEAAKVAEVLGEDAEDDGMPPEPSDHEASLQAMSGQ